MPNFSTSILSTNYIYCPVCKGETFSRIANINGYTVVKCDACHLFMVNPQPTSDDLSKFYGEKYYSNPDLITHLSYDQIMLASEGKKAAFSDVLMNLRSLSSGKRLLDIGCAFGQFMALARELDFDATGVELNPFVAAQARQFGFNVLVGDFQAIDWTDSIFDIITAWYVLEHVKDPYQVLKCAYDILSPRGILFLRVPNLTFGKPFLWLSRLGITKYPSIFSHIPAHLFFFTPETLTQLCLSVGFKSVKFETGNPVLSPPNSFADYCSNLARKLYSSGSNLIMQFTRGRLIITPYISLYTKK